MRCPKCGSTDTTVQLLNEVKLKVAHHNIFWWLFIGWWWIVFKWLFLFFPALLAKIFLPRRRKAVNKTVKKGVCNNCGNVWKLQKSNMNDTEVTEKVQTAMIK